MKPKFIKFRSNLTNVGLATNGRLASLALALVNSLINYGLLYYGHRTIYDQNGHQFHTNPIPTLASSLDEDIEYRRLYVDNNFVIKLNRRYLNTGFIC